MTAFEVLPDVEQRTPEWYAARRQGVSASEVAAILGLSPYVSAFDLWWHKVSGIDSQPDDDIMRRGRRAEPLIIEDFEEAHPELLVIPGGLVRNAERPWQLATPDGVVYERGEDDLGRMLRGESDPIGTLEAKTAANPDEWGESGTDDIPMYYRCQVLWQMDALGVQTAFVPCWFGFGYREYVVEYDPDDAALLRKAARDFLDSIEAGEQPDIDAHKATRRRLKRLHPELTDDAVEVPATLLRNYQLAKKVRDRAQERMDLAENQLRALIGSAEIAEYVDGAGKRRKFKHSIYDVAPRVQEVSGFTVDRLNMPRKAIP